MRFASQIVAIPAVSACLGTSSRRLKKATIRRNRALGQIDQTGARIGRTAGLIKSNMPIATNAEQPQIHTATRPYLSFKSLALEIGIHCHAIGYMRIPQLDIRTRKKRVIHKIAITLWIRAIKPPILIEIKGGQARKIQTLPICSHEFGNVLTGVDPVAKPSTASGFWRISAAISDAAARATSSGVSQIFT